jgi:hypothetical protein
MYMNMTTQAILQDGDAVKGPDGTNYPGNWDKTTLTFLKPVTMTPKPTDPTVIVGDSLVEVVNGVPVLVWATTPVPPITLTQAQATAMGKLSDAADTALNAPVTLSALGFATSFAPQWAGLITAAKDAVTANPALTIQWMAVDNSFHALTAAQVLSIWAACSTYVQAVYANQAALTSALNALTTVASVQTFNLTTGWPSTTV